MKRDALAMGLALLLALAALGIGLATAFLAASNRARAGELDRLEHRCELFARQSQLLGELVAGEEWRLRCGDERGAPASKQAPEFER